MACCAVGQSVAKCSAHNLGVCLKSKAPVLVFFASSVNNLHDKRGLQRAS
jgi:hypothetical protein